MRRRLLLPTLLALSLVSPLLAQREATPTFSGRVVAVSDGDTIGVLRDGKEVKVRFHGIDAPETGQAFGDNAKRFTSERVYGKTVSVRVVDTDRYGRLVGVVTVGDGPSINESLVKDGLAWWYHQYGAQERPLALAEIEARAARRGLWKDANPTPPWAFRNPGPGNPAGGRALDTERAGPRRAESTVGNGVAPPTPRGEAAAAPQGATVYITRTGAKYHRDGCRHLKSRIASTLAAAQAKGLTACGVCRP